MKRRTWLTGVGLVLALGPGASSALASGEVRVGATELTYSANDPGGTTPDNEANNVTISPFGAGQILVRDSAATLTDGNAVGGCDLDPADSSQAFCPAVNISSITVLTKSGTDTVTIDIGIASFVGAGSGADRVDGSSVNDTIRGDAGQDVLFGRGGDDRIDTQGLPGAAEADKLNCGAGADTAITDGFDGFVQDDGVTPSTVPPPGGCEQVNPTPPPGTTPPPTPPPGPGPSQFQAAVNPILPGGNVPNTVPPAPRDIACRTNTFLGTAGNDRFLGTPSGDRMVGLAGNDLMDGLAGEDCLFGQAGIDTMRGGAGDDRISGGDGNDRGDGGAGADGIYGSAGVDTLYGRAGNDVVSGGLGSDKLFGEAGADRMTGSAGNDRISSGAGNDRIVAGTGRDQVYGSAGNDLIDVRDNARDVVSCGPGRDTVVRDRRDVLRNCERRASRLPRQR